MSQAQRYIDNELPVELRFNTQEWRRRTLLAILLASGQLTLAFFMFSVALGKLIEHGVYAYVCHFTNWSWTFQMVFYFFTLPAPFVLLGLISPANCLAQLSQFILFIGFFPLHGIVWTVMSAVTVLLGTRSPFLRNIFAIYPAEIVIIGNDLFHTYPVLIILIYTIVYHKLLFYALNRFIARRSILDSAARISLLIFYQSYIGAGAALAVYTIIFDPRVVYSTELPVVAGIAIAFATMTVVNLLPIIALLALKGVASRDAFSYVWLVNNSGDPAATEPLRSSERALEGGKRV